MSEIFEAVYYSEPVPPSLRVLTLLGLVFDRVHFPGVYIPASGVDEAATQAEIERIQGLERHPSREYDTGVMLNCMIYAINARHLKEFCIFPGRTGFPGVLESGAEDLVREFERLLYGPPREGFSPTYNMGFAKGLPGDEDAAVNGPSWLAYPPNAILYAARHDLLIVNDNPHLPFLSEAPVRSNAKVIAAALALESLKLVLPSVRALSFEELAEFRAETGDLAKPFRLAMLRLSRDVNAALLSDATLGDVRREAEFLAQSTVLPELEEFRAILLEPSKPWYRRIVDLATEVPELVGNFATMSAPMASAKVLAALGKVLADVRDDQLAKEGIVKRGAYHYLLKVEDLT
jgi:hypothetical protein